MIRPKGLALSALLMALCNVMLWGIVTPGRPPYTLRLYLFYTFVIFVGYVFIWFYWKGRNWARIAVLLVSCLSILQIGAWNNISRSRAILTTPAHLTLAARAVLGAVLLYWLNTRPVRAFFMRGKEAPPQA